jgi:hypothetical protein
MVWEHAVDPVRDAPNRLFARYAVSRAAIFRAFNPTVTAIPTIGAPANAARSGRVAIRAARRHLVGAATVAADRHPVITLDGGVDCRVVQSHTHCRRFCRQIATRNDECDPDEKAKSRSGNPDALVRFA